MKEMRAVCVCVCVCVCLWEWPTGSCCSTETHPFSIRFVNCSTWPWSLDYSSVWLFCHFYYALLCMSDKDLNPQQMIHFTILTYKILYIGVTLTTWFWMQGILTVWFSAHRVVEDMWLIKTQASLCSQQMLKDTAEVVLSEKAQNRWDEHKLV